LVVAGIVASRAFSLPPEQARLHVIVTACAFLLLGLLPTLISLRLFVPRMPPAFLYLRNFRTDADTLQLKWVLQSILGKDARLAGIRPPRRRVPAVLRPLLLPYLALTYSDPKHMELEAQDDWPARLWRSLAESRGAFLDLRQVSPGVALERDLTAKALGLSRIAYVVDGSRTNAEWRALIAEAPGIENEDVSDAHLLEWREDSFEANSEFAKAAAAFATRVSAFPRGLAWDADPQIATHALDGERVLRRDRMRMTLLTLLGVGLLYGVGPALTPWVGPSAAGWAQASLGVLAFFFYFLSGLGHLRGLRRLHRAARVLNPPVARLASRRRMLLAFGVLLPSLLAMLAVAAAAGVRAVVPVIMQKAAITKSTDNLRSLTMFMLHRSAMGRPYPALEGKNFTLHVIAAGELDWRMPGAVAMLFSPADPRSRDSLDVKRYGELTKESLKSGRFDDLTSYAGRRNVTFPLRPGPEPEPLFADVCIPGVVLIAFNNGAVERFTYAQLGLPEDLDPNETEFLGEQTPAGASDLLRRLSK
jgi:hypothetical protein